MYECMYVCMYACVYIYIYIHMRMCMCVYVCILCLCVYICISILYIYIYTYIRRAGAREASSSPGAWRRCRMVSAISSGISLAPPTACEAAWSPGSSALRMKWEVLLGVRLLGTIFHRGPKQVVECRPPLGALPLSPAPRPIIHQA